MSTTTEPDVELSVESGRSRRVNGSQITQRYALVFVLAAVLVFFSMYGPTSDVYLTQANVVTVLGNQTVGLIVALAAVIPLTANVLDLSVGAVAGLSSVIAAGAMAKEDWPAWAAILLAITVGTGVGALNGWLVTRFRFDPIIETLAVGMLITGATTWYTNGTPISGNLPQGLTDFGSLNWLGVPRLMFVLVPVVLATWYLTEHTPFGRSLAAIGSNRSAAGLVGIRVDRTIATSMAMSGFLASVAGILLVARSGSADTQSGPSYLFPALAAVFLGATAIKPGFPNVLGTVVGAFFVAFTVSGLNIAGTSLWAPNVFNGASLLVALWVMTRFGIGRPAKRAERASSTSGGT